MLERAHATVDLADRGEGILVERLGAHRDVTVLDGGHSCEDPVVEPVTSAVEHVGAHRPPGLQVVPHELEDTRRHVVMANDVVRSTDHLLARVACQEEEGPVRVADDALEVRR